MTSRIAIPFRQSRDSFLSLELLATKENTLPTENKKIYCAQVREYDYNDICIVMNPLINLAIRVDKMETVRMMKRIVPEFKSKNSEYEMLD